MRGRGAHAAGPVTQTRPPGLVAPRTVVAGAPGPAPPESSRGRTRRRRTAWDGRPGVAASRATAPGALADAAADKPGAEIKLYINSPGGVVTSGMVMYDTIKMIQSPVSTICMGLAASMGSILLSAGAKGHRYIYPHGEVMIHQPSLGGYYQATSADIEIQANQILKTKQLGAKILAENCNKTVEQILADFDRDYWMDATEAVAYGIADSILNKI